MKKFLMVFLLSVSFCGCMSSSAKFVKNMDASAQTILPQYKSYVLQDQTIQQKEALKRLETADRMRALIDVQKSKK
jgi:hypothetical protein